MAIADCTHCSQPYWTYRSDFPPKGYCSAKCWEERRRPAKKKAPPESPHTILGLMYEHRRVKHQSTSILAEFGCKECDTLEAVYTESLQWHYAALERQKNAEAKRPRKAKAKMFG